METINTTTRVTLASLVKNTLERSNGTEVTVKDVLTEVQFLAAQAGVTVNVNYRGIYQQLKTQAIKTKRGSFISKSSFNQVPTEEQVAA